MQTLTDTQILARHHTGAHRRVRMELTIVDALIEAAKLSGYKLEVVAGGESDEYGDGEPYDVKTALFDLDDAYVYVLDSEGEDLGWIRLVFGNGGDDLISNYSITLDDFLKPINDLAKSL